MQFYVEMISFLLSAAFVQNQMTQDLPIGAMEFVKRINQVDSVNRKVQFHEIKFPAFV